MEISSPYFWSGAPWDMVARKVREDVVRVWGDVRLEGDGHFETRPYTPTPTPTPS
jgi:hypothetical protein